MRALALSLLLALAAPAWAADYYVDESCANNGDGSSPTCAASAAAPGAFNVATSCTAAVGNTCFICGTYSAAYNPGGVTGSGGYYVVDGDCPANPGVMTRATGAQMSIGGSSRARIKVQNLTFENGVTGIDLTGHTSGGTDFVIQDNTFSNMSTAGVKLTPPADSTVSAISVRNNTFADIGDGVYANAAAAVNVVPVQQGVGAASGLVTGLLVHDNTLTSSSESESMYGVNFKPPTNSSTGGRVRASKVYDNHFAGAFAGHAINIYTDSDDTVVYGNTFAGTFGGAVIHVGGQTDKGTTCGSTTDNTVIMDHEYVAGGVVNSQFAVDGAGIYPDECSVGTRVLRNVMAGNEVAGLYLNDSDSTLAVGNLIFGNGDNAIHFHGVGTGNSLYANTIFHAGATSANGNNDQGLDGVQIDAGTTGTVMVDNVIVCGANTPKCVDADVAFGSESHNDIYTAGSTRVEGFTPTSSLNIDPVWVGGASPNTADGFCLSADSPLLAAGTYIGAYATGYDNEDLGKPPAIGARGLCSGRRAVSSRRTVSERRAP